MEILAKGVELGERAGYNVSCGFVDTSGRTVGALRNPASRWMTIDLAVQKAVLSSAMRTDTQSLFLRWQAEKPLFGAAIAGLSDGQGWFVGPGGVPLHLEVGAEMVAVGAVGISGAGTTDKDHEIAQELVDWVASR